MSDPLPERPNLDWLRKHAKRALDALRQSSPDARLSDAQLQIARQYGFSSWRALKAHIETLTIEPLVSSALEQAERATPAVKAAALLSVARIVKVRDRDEAMRVLERGIGLTRTLREPARRVLLGEAFMLAVLVSPERALALLPELDEAPDQHHRVAFALQKMFEQGDHDDAIRYLLGASEEPGFPYDAVGTALHVAKDAGTRTGLMRKAIRAAHASLRLTRPRLPHDLSELLGIWSEHWRVLPADEAASIVRELVAAIVAAPDERGQYTLQGSRFSSTRQFLLFHLFGPCRHLEPELAESLAAEHPQLARAVSRFQYGLQSMYEGAHSQAPASHEPTEPHPEPDLAELAQMDYLSLDDFLPVAEELRTNFDRAFTIALSAYARDTDSRRPNLAPQQCWPSAMYFRSILHRAGVYEGHEATRHLDRIPDPALRLFAHIELAAALAGLHQAPGTTMTQVPGRPMRRPHLSGGAETIEETPFEPPATPPFAGKPDVPPSYDVHITPSQLAPGNPPTGGCDADFWVIQGARVRTVLSHLFDVSPTRIVVPSSLDHERYDFTLVLPREETREVLLDRMRTGVERHFVVRRERQSMNVQVLTAPHGVQAREAYSEFGGGIAGISGGSFGYVQSMTTSTMPDFEHIAVASLMDLSFVLSAHRSTEEEMRLGKRRFLRSLSSATGVIDAIQQTLTMSELCTVFEGALEQVFVDETGVTGSYAIDAQADVTDSGAFVAFLCKKLGLVVTPARRDVEMLIVGRT